MTKKQAAEQYDSLPHSIHHTDSFMDGWDACLANFWIDAVENKPEISRNDKLAALNQSDWVLVWAQDEKRPHLAYYDHAFLGWYVTDIDLKSVLNRVKYFAYITNPYQQEK